MVPGSVCADEVHVGSKAGDKCTEDRSLKITQTTLSHPPILSNIGQMLPWKLTDLGQGRKTKCRETNANGGVKTLAIAL